MQNDIVKRPTPGIVDRSTDKNKEKKDLKSEVINTPIQPPANVDSTVQKSSLTNIAPANNLTNENLEQPKSTEEVNKKHEKDLPQTFQATTKRVSNLPVIPIVLAIIVCFALIALVVMSQLKIIS